MDCEFPYSDLMLKLNAFGAFSPSEVYEMKVSKKPLPSKLALMSDK